jgi:dynein light intermediate chain
VERGLLLFNIRNEIRMTFNSLNYLRESSVAFGLRKALKYNYQNIETENEVNNELI